MNKCVTPQDFQIIDCLKNNYGISVQALTELPLGADSNASVYRAETLEKISYFVKLKHGHEDHISLAILKWLQQSNVQLIIPPMTTKDQQSFTHMGDFTLTVYPFIEGKNGFNQNLTDDQWITLGKGLRQVHELKVPPAIAEQLRRENFSPSFRQMVRGFYPLFEGKPFGDKISQDLLAFIKTYISVIHQLVDRSEFYAQKCQHDSAPLVLCHADIHAGNVLIAEDHSLYIVDWDVTRHTMLAPKERDLMFIGAGVGNVWNKHSEEELFYQGYGDTQINMNLLAYYRHERIVEDIAEYVQQLLLSTAGGENRAIMYQHFIDMFEPEGVVDRAML